MDEQRVREIVREELTNFSPPKKKRAPNKWQIFLKDCVKKQDGDIKYTEKVQLCSIEYKETKKSNNGSMNSSNFSDIIVPTKKDIKNNKENRHVN